MNIRFNGAAQTVTGSHFLLDLGGKNYLIDCGMFQGPDVFELNYNSFTYDPSGIEAVFLTHAHIDHSGLLPKLVANGFSGSIYCTPPTRRIVEELLLDSAKVQEKNYKFRGVAPLYDLQDSIQTIEQLKVINFDDPVKINDLQVTYRFASHILGAASVEIHSAEGNVCFSGDLGRRDPTIIDSYKACSPDMNVIVMEALYGGSEHEDLDITIRRLANIVNTTLDRNGNVIIPVFAVHRSQEILYFLNMLQQNGGIPNNVQIFFDSPLGERILKIYTSSKTYFSDDFKQLNNPFGLDGVHFVRKNKESLKLSNQNRSIIIAGGGMADGGRVINHINAQGNRGNSSLVFVGYQAEGTLGREIIQRPESIYVGNRKINLKINIEELYGFSAHGDASDLEWWLRRYDDSQVKKVALVHAEKEQSEAFKNRIGPSYDTIIPALGDKIEL